MKGVEDGEYAIEVDMEENSVVPYDSLSEFAVLALLTPFKARKFTATTSRCIGMDDDAADEYYGVSPHVSVLKILRIL